MKKIVLTVIVVIVATFTIMSQDFRKTTWGMSKSQVKSIESSGLVSETSELLVYQATLAHFEVQFGYIFSEDKLTRAKYILTETHSNNNDYISDYNVLNNLLKKKYGEPVEDEIYWKTDSSFKNDKSYWGFSISQGELILYSIYRTSNTEIKIMLSAEDFNIVNEIQYSSMSAELNSLEEEKVLEDF
jgi:hypothetical protein